MNSDPYQTPADPHSTARLTAFDDSLASDTLPSAALSPPPEDQALLHLLDQLRPRPVAQPSAAPDEPRYVLVGLHAAGGVGQVWLARDADLGRDVALKVLRPERALDPVQEARFFHEARVTGRLQHPGIVPVYELVASPGPDQPPFYTMRLVPGRTLAEAIRAHHGRGGADARVERNRLLNAFVAVCQTVAFAHSKGVIHRDLKPQNVALGEFGEVVVLDWGFAKEFGSTEPAPPEGDDAPLVPPGHTLWGQVVGTPAYMAPEQAEGRPGADTAAADVYGLGAILYEILTGRPPYLADSSSAILRAVRAAPPPRPSAVARLPRALEAVCLRAMAREPGARYASAAALARDVQHWLADEPVEAYREPRLERLRRFARRHPALIAGGCALAVAALVSVAVVRELVAHERAASAEAQTKAAREQAVSIARQEAELRRQLYFHRVALAERNLGAQNLPGATRLLAECPPLLRGWEWHCLDRLCRADALALKGHANTVAAVAFSPDGHLLASAGFDGGIRVWDVATGQARFTYTAHHGLVYHLTFSPDGRHVASAGWDGTVRVWEPAAGRTVQTLTGLGPHVNRVAYLPDGRRLLTLDQDKVVRLWDLESGRALWKLDGDGDTTWHLMTLVVRADGRLAAVAGGFAPIRLIDPETGRVTGRLEGQPRLIRALAFSPDGKTLASGDGDVGRNDPGEVRLWDLETRTVRQVFSGHTEPIFAVDFHPGGNRLVSASQDRTVKIWDLDAAQEALTLHRHTGALRCAAFSPDGRRLVTAGAEGVVRVWDAMSEPDPPPERLLHSAPDPDGVVFAVAFEPGGRRLASIGEGRVVRFHADGVPDGVSPPLGTRADYFALAYSPDGRRLGTADSAGTVMVLDARTGAVERALNGHGGGPIRGVAFSPDSALLATASWDRTVRIWDVASGDERHILDGHREAVNGVAFSPDGRLVASAGNDRTARIWDAASGVERQTLRHPGGAVLAVAFSPSEPLLATSAADGEVRVWDTRTWHVRHVMRGHAGAVRALAFSPNGELLASAGQDWTVRIWRPATGQEAITLRGFTERVDSLAFHPDGSRLATAGYDRTVKVWDVSAP